MKWISRAKWSVLVTLTLLLLANALFPPPLDKAYRTSIRVTDRHDQWMSAFTVEDGTWRLKADISEIDERYIERLIRIEDRRFYTHSGVDPIAIARALRSWGREGRAVSGASTLTMQLVRQLEPRERTLGAKFIEALRAVQIEMRLSKDEILSLYLAHVPYGGNIEGVNAAALVYFDKQPDQLTDAEIALLIALPQAPDARRPDRHPKAAQAARDTVLERLQGYALLTDRQLEEAKEVVVEKSRHTISQTAWLTAQRLRPLAKKRQSKIRSSLDLNLQKDVQYLAAGFTQKLDFNVSVLVVDNETIKVRAHVGSAGRDRPGGWIDMAARPRSPGSTLKPLIYGFAFDDGLSAPGSFIMDAPTRFGTYQPENFNRRYHGDVRIHEALAHSLNVPAVIALDKIGTNRFAAALELSGTNVRVPGRKGGKTGLALALGGAGLRADDLAVLYAALANGGQARPLLWQEDADPGKSYQMMGEDSAAEITKILRQAPTPGGRVPHWLSQNSHAIAYKTGTSYGFRDAWAAGYTDKWTVIVWAGRPDGAPRVGKTGRMAAAPLLFDVFALLPDAQGNKAYQKMAAAPIGLKTFGGAPDEAPVLLFPPDGAEVAVDDFSTSSKGFTLTARSPSRAKLKWYVEGRPVPAETLSGAAVWHPEKQGFYKVSVVDEKGRSTSARVRVMAFE